MFLSCHVRLLSCHSMLSLVCNIHDKENYLVYITALKQALNHGLILRTEAKHDFEKDFFKLMNNSVFGKTVENVRRNRDIKLVPTIKRRNQLTSERNYHTTK